MLPPYCSAARGDQRVDQPWEQSRVSHYKLNKTNELTAEHASEDTAKYPYWPVSLKKHPQSAMAHQPPEHSRNLEKRVAEISKIQIYDCIVSGSFWIREDMLGNEVTGHVEDRDIHLLISYSTVDLK